MKRKLTYALTLGALILTVAHASDLTEALRKLSENGPVHYQPPPSYYDSPGYYPYSAPPPNIPDPQRNQHAYDVGYRVGQDDFLQQHSKHFVRHTDLFDDSTRDAFAHGYDTGYDVAREAAARRDREYYRAKVAPTPIPSEHYKSGFYPYTPPPKEASSVDRQRHAYDVGYRVGQDDAHKNLAKHFTRHEKLYDKDTHDSFAAGYDKGYDRARK
jgi:hypothetical protein